MTDIAKMREALFVLEQATTFASQKARDMHTRAVAGLRCCIYAQASVSAPVAVASPVAPWPEFDASTDPMYEPAKAIVLEHRRASISLVQRHLRIGYNRAARLLERMEKEGVCGPLLANGGRELLLANPV